MVFSGIEAGQVVAAAALLFLAVVHSVLGERAILQPLFADSSGDASTAKAEVPNWARNRILQFTWHLTSMAWIALAAIAIGVDALVSIGVLCLVSAVVIFAALRGHLAWPVFLVGGIAALAAAGEMSEWAAQAMGWSAVIGLIAAAMLHVYWVVGGRWLLDVALPPAAEGRTFQPGPWLTLAVAAALAALAGLLSVDYLNLGASSSVPTIVRVLAWIGVVVLTARAVGDGRHVGFSKKLRGSRFAEADDACFTPFVTFLVIGASVGLLLG